VAEFHEIPDGLGAARSTDPEERCQSGDLKSSTAPSIATIAALAGAFVVVSLVMIVAFFSGIAGLALRTRPGHVSVSTTLAAPETSAWTVIISTPHRDRRRTALGVGTRRVPTPIQDQLSGPTCALLAPIGLPVGRA